MDKIHTVITAGITAILMVVALSFTTLFDGEPGMPGMPGNSGEPVAVGGAVNPFDYMVVGGVERAYRSTPSLIQATSSVICSLQSPSATSTLVDGGIQVINSSTTGATPVTIWNSTKQFAPSGDQIAIIASQSEDVGFILPAASSTYNAAALADRVFKPDTYFVVTQTGGGTLTQTGICQAEFEVYR